MIFRAIKFVAEAHAGQFRKGTKIPYITHLMNVMKTLCDSDCKTEIIVAGILHDVVEDTPVTIDIVERTFGKQVAVIVSGASEPDELKRDSHPEITWKPRKQHTIDSLKSNGDLGVLLVACADKLDNTRAILQDYSNLGEYLWTRFNAGKEDQKWYYESLAEVFLKRGKEFGNPLLKLASELDYTVKQIFKE